MSRLQQPTLVLNRAWTPIRTTPVREAICLVAKGSALFVEPETYATYDFRTWAELRAAETEPALRTVALRLRVPEVVLLTVYNRLPEKAIVFSRRNLFKRDRYACQYCGAQPGTEELTIDHVLPRSRGGTSTWENCVLACVRCNTRKASRTPVEAGLRLRSKPVKPDWKSVFTIQAGSFRPSWKDFVSDAYWNVPLEE